VLGALVAVTAHVVAELAVSREPFIKHPEPVTVKLTAPVPEPPLLYKTTGMLKLEVREVFEINSGA
jgi:hypothetical protein